MKRRYSVGQVAKKLGVHLSTSWRYILRGVRGRKLGSRLIGGRRYVTESDLEAFLAPEDSGDAIPSVDDCTATRKLDDILGS